MSNKKINIEVTNAGEILVNKKLLFSDLEQAIQAYKNFIQIKYSETVILFIFKEGKIFKLMEIGDLIEDLTKSTSVLSLEELTTSLKKELTALPETNYLNDLIEVLSFLIQEKKKNVRIIGNFIELLISVYSALEANRTDSINWKEWKNYCRLFETVKINPYRSYLQDSNVKNLKELPAIVRDGNLMEAQSRIKKALDFLAPLYPLEITFPLGSKTYQIKGGSLKEI